MLSGGPLHPQMADCTHLDTVVITELPEEVAGCEACLEAGGEWCHLRICLQCGNIGCCDSSVMRHATGHFRETTHPVMQSAEPLEDWRWCFVHHVTA